MSAAAGIDPLKAARVALTLNPDLEARKAGWARLVANPARFKAELRRACRADLWGLLAFVLRRPELAGEAIPTDPDAPAEEQPKGPRFLSRKAQLWLLARCDEVQADPDGHLDLWAREHYKSTIITFGKTIQDIITDPNVTIAIFSHNRPNARGFLRHIKRELEQNELLKFIFDDILYQEPEREALQWSEVDGLVVKRQGNPKEATLEAWGIIDAQPTGKHFGLMVYDDVITLDHVGTPDMRKKVIEAIEVSFNLGVEGGRRRMIGTRWHFADAYADLVSRGTAAPRLHPAADPSGEPVFLTAEGLARRLVDQGPYAFASQMMLNPKGGDQIGFKPEWRRIYHGTVGNSNRYIIFDPANGKKKKNDYSAIWVFAACEDENYYCLDLVRDRLNLAERIEVVIKLHKAWRPLVVGWEEYGLTADLQALEMHQNATGYRFPTVSLGGNLSKEDRIMRLVPLCAAGRFWMPEQIARPCKYSGRVEDMVRIFYEEEFLGWPYVSHDDMLDGASRLLDDKLGVIFPKPAGHHAPARRARASGSSARLY